MFQSIVGVAAGGKNQDEQLLSLEDTLQFQEDTSNSLTSRRSRLILFIHMDRPGCKTGKTGFQAL